MVLYESDIIMYQVLLQAFFLIFNSFNPECSRCYYHALLQLTEVSPEKLLTCQRSTATIVHALTIELYSLHMDYFNCTDKYRE